jgi:hypothetical protein
MCAASLKVRTAGSTKADEFMKQKQETLAFYKKLFFFSLIFTGPVLLISMGLNYVPGTSSHFGFLLCLSSALALSLSLSLSCV